MNYLLGVLAAFAFGANWVLQQHEAAQAPTHLQLNPVRLIGTLVRRPLWLLGLVALLAGSGVQQVALDDGNLAVQESILVLDLVFAMVIADRVSRRSVSRVQWAGAATVCVGLAAFLVAADPSAGSGGGSVRRWAVVLIVIGAGCACCCVIAVAARGSARAVLFATAAGVMFGLSDALSKAGFSFDHPGLLHVLVHWQIYAVVVVAVLALGASQIAYNAAPLAVSLPSLAVCEPVAGLVIGVAVLGVHFRTGAGVVTVEAIGAAAVLAGSLVIGRSPVLDLAPSQPAG